MLHISQGTVRVKTVRLSNGTMEWKLFFVPDDAHSVKKNNEQYAVFVDWNTGNGTIIQLEHTTGNVRGVLITVDSAFLGVSGGQQDPHGQLAMPLLASVLGTQGKVEVEVDISGAKGQFDVKLVGLTYP